MPLLVDIRKFTVINSLIEESSHNVAQYLESMTGVEAGIDVTGLTFLDPVDIAKEMGEETMYGVQIELKSPPYGIFLLTFSENTAKGIAEFMTGQPVEDGFSDMQMSALQEISNVLASGFIDGWANTLNTNIDIGTPDVRKVSGGDLAEDVVSHVHQNSLSIVIDTMMEVEREGEEFDLKFYMVPDIGSFVHLIDNLSLG